MEDRASAADWNPKKRPRVSHDDSDELERQLLSASNLQNTSQPQPVATIPPWNVAGHYKVFDTEAKVDTSTGYELTIFFKRTSEPYHLYGRLKLGHLFGIMRLCPRTDPQGRPYPNAMCLKDFENACNLKRGDNPGPVRKTWFMRWRARETGMGLGKLVGGEFGVNMCLQFMQLPGPEMLFAGQLRWHMLHNNTFFQFGAIKQKGLLWVDLSYGRPDIHWEGYRRDWDSMYDPKWQNNEIVPRWLLSTAKNREHHPTPTQEAIPQQGLPARERREGNLGETYAVGHNTRSMSCTRPTSSNTEKLRNGRGVKTIIEESKQQNKALSEHRIKASSPILQQQQPTPRRAMLIDITEDGSDDEVQNSKPTQNLIGQAQSNSPYLSTGQFSPQHQNPLLSQSRPSVPTSLRKPLPSCTSRDGPVPAPQQVPATEVHHQQPSLTNSRPKLITVAGSIPGTAYWTINPNMS